MGDNIVFPVVRLTIEGMKHTIMQYFSAHLDDIQVATEQAVKAACESFDIEAEAARIARETIPKELRSTIQRAISSAMWRDNKLKDAVYKAVVKALAERSIDTMGT